MNAVFDGRRVLVVLLVAVSIGFPLIRTTNLFAASTVRDTNYAEGSLSLPLVFGSLFVLAACLAWQQRRAVWEHARSLNPFLILTLVWCVATVLWSPYPVTTIKRCVQLLGLILIGLVIAPPIGNGTLVLRALRTTLMVLLVISCLVSLALPQVGVDYALGGAWRGIFWHKNILGMAAGFCMLLWVHELRAGKLPWKLVLLGAAFCAAMLVMAKSTTSLIVYTLGLGIYLFLARDYLRNRYVPACLALCGIVVLVVGFLLAYTVLGRMPTSEEIVGPIAGLFNKSADLTGRGDIWVLVLLEISRHPWQGIGYGAFWLGVGSAQQFTIDALNYIALQAHNGYLDILNELGIIGVVITGGLLLVHGWQLSRWLRIDREQAALHAAFFIVILITNLSESVLFRGVQFQYVWLIYSSALLTASLRQARLARAATPSGSTA